MSSLIFYRIFGNLASAFLPMFQIIHARVLRWFCVSNYEYVIVSNDLISKQATYADISSEKSFIILSISKCQFWNWFIRSQYDSLWKMLFVKTSVQQTTCFCIHIFPYYKCNWNDSTSQCSQRWHCHTANLRTVHQNYKEMISQMFYVV